MNIKEAEQAIIEQVSSICAKAQKYAELVDAIEREIEHLQTGDEGEEDEAERLEGILECVA